MADLVSTVWVRDENDNPVAFGPGDEIPDWARKQMGDHCFVPDEDSDNKPAPKTRRR